jgi:acetylornithine/succinyldiaminopimelate/putrescine aminotransferase
VRDTSVFIKTELERVRKSKETITAVRGYGTMLGFDVKDNKAAKLQKFLHQGGVYTVQQGQHSIHLTPALILEAKHAAHLRDTLGWF